MRAWTHLNLHFEVSLEVWEQRHEDGEAEVEHLRYRWYAILAECNTQVLFDSGAEGVVATEYGTSTLHNAQQHFQGQDLGPQLVRSGDR